MEELRESWFSVPDLPAQKKIAADIQLHAFQSVPYWPLGLARLPTAYLHNITGVTQGFAKFWNVRRV
jgi:peptide/nickel transport system substrate-binding protein